MKVLRGIVLGFWVTVMAGCVGLIATYYILSQTILNPAAVKGWFNDSGVYRTLIDMEAKNSAQIPASSSIVTPKVMERAIRAGTRPDDVRKKAEPIIDAVYAWLDSKNPDIEFSLSTKDDYERLMTALRSELTAHIKTLPACDQYVAPEELATATCLPSYVTVDTAVDTVMKQIREQDSLSEKVLTPEALSLETKSDGVRLLPDLISYLWVAQLMAMPVLAIIALVLVIKRRGGGLISVASALLSSSLTLFILVGLIHFGGASLIDSLSTSGETENMALIEPLVREALKDVGSTALSTGLLLTITSVVLGGLGFWWRKHSRRRATISS